jgi:hypothetical protein
MNNKMTTTFILIFIVVLLIGTLLVFLIINRADEKFNQILSKILIALIAAIVLIGFELLIPPKPIEKKVKVLILCDKSNTDISKLAWKLIKTNSKHKNGYSLMGRVETFSSTQLENKQTNFVDIGLDNLEYSFWAWLGERYSIHWDTEREYFEGISGGGGSIRRASDASEKTRAYEYQELKDLFKSNHLMPEKEGMFCHKVHFPQNTVIEIKKHSNSRREYLIKNKYYNLTIAMYSIFSTELSGTSLGNKIISDSTNTWNKLYTRGFIVNMKCEFSRIRKGSPELIKQKKWVTEIMNGFEYDFSWENIEPELVKAYEL